MNALNWLEKLLDNVADRGRELVGLGEPEAPSDLELCQRLLEGLGEASNIALARELLARWRANDNSGRLDFLQLLASEFDPDEHVIAEAAAAYTPGDPTALQRLIRAVEPPRQEVLRRLNMAPGGTETLVQMRASLLGALPTHPRWQGVEADFRHLLASWFNRGFLRLERIDWDSPASVLEKLIDHEAVHPMSGWHDLRRRLGSDRRCFAFFHPALPREPLIFVEVALTDRISDRIAPLIDPNAPEDAPAQAECAVFYSINNTQAGLRGVSFGNFLLKQVVEELRRESPAIQVFVTLSPVPRLRECLTRICQEDPVQAAWLRRLLAEHRAATPQLADAGDWPQALDKLLTESPDASETLAPLLSDLTLFYLTRLKRGAAAFDPVAHFHLSNGARLERINPQANPSARGLVESWGCMVNYRYDGADLVANHEAYARQGEIALSRPLRRRRRQLDELLRDDAADER